MMKSSRVERDEFWGGRSFHRPGTVKENVLESDFEPLCDGTTRRRSLAHFTTLTLQDFNDFYLERATAPHYKLIIIHVFIAVGQILKLN